MSRAATSTCTMASFALGRPGAVFALVVLGFIALAAVLAPLIAPQDPFDLAGLDILDSELPPIWQDGSEPRFVLGTDAQGRDLFSAVLYGARISLLIGLLAVVIQAAIGVSLGLLAGYYGGTLDSLVTRLADIQLSLSTLMMAIVVMALVRAGLGGAALSQFAVPLLVVVIGLSEWPIFARTARAAVLVEAPKDYVRAARAVGAKRPLAAGHRGDHPGRGRHHGRGCAVLSWPRHAGHEAVPRYADPLWL